MIHNGNEIKDFKEHEFNDNVSFADPDLFLRLQKQRNIMNCAMSTSKVKGSLARLKYKLLSLSDYRRAFLKDPGMHYVLSDKKSTAIDLFCSCDPFEAYTKILMSGLWDGIGVYFDTSNNKGLQQVMFHMDFGRKSQLIWYRDNGKYVYNSQPGFYTNLKSKLMARYW